MRWITWISPKKPKQTGFLAVDNTGKSGKTSVYFSTALGITQRSFFKPPSRHKKANSYLFNIRFSPFNSFYLRKKGCFASKFAPLRRGPHPSCLRHATFPKGEGLFTEKQTKHFGITARINRTLHTEQTEFQKLDMVETEEFGNMLILDGMVMTTEKDEFVYHEMVAHVPLFTHPNPENVLVVGGGDGGVIREVLKHPSVKKATLVEIDGKVIEYSKQCLPL